MDDKDAVADRLKARKTQNGRAVRGVHRKKEG